MAMSLAVHDVFPGTSGQTQTPDAVSPNVPNRIDGTKLSYADIATGKFTFSHQSGLLNNDVGCENTLSENNEVLDGNGVVSQSAILSSSAGEEPGALVEQSDSKASQYSRDVWQTAVENMERDNIIREKIGLIINERYRIMQKISFGSYGSIYSAVDIHTNKDVAVKFEVASVPELGHAFFFCYHPVALGTKPASELHLKYESEVYRSMRGELGVPVIYWFGSEYNHQILVMQLLGPSLEQLFSFCEREFNWNTIVSLADQMLLRLWSLHSRGYIHRDIKPENFLMGIGEFENTCFLVDFGLARRYRYRDGIRLTHIPYRKGKSLVGTAKYASINSHNGVELSRRDDLESLGYIIIEFIIRDLPWKEQRGKARFRSKQQCYNRIRNLKEQADWSAVCPKMVEWISYCRQLGFSEEPDYVYLRSLIQSLMHSNRARGRQECFAAKNQRNASKTQAKGICKNHYGRNSTGDNVANKEYFRRFDDGTKRYSWLMRRDASPSQRYTFDCLFRWTLPPGSEAQMPPFFRNNGTSFNYGASHVSSFHGTFKRSEVH